MDNETALQLNTLQREIDICYEQIEQAHLENKNQTIKGLYRSIYNKMCDISEITGDETNISVDYDEQTINAIVTCGRTDYFENDFQFVDDYKESEKKAIKDIEKAMNILEKYKPSAYYCLYNNGYYPLEIDEIEGEDLDLTIVNTIQIDHTYTKQTEKDLRGIIYRKRLKLLTDVGIGILKSKKIIKFLNEYILV